jgi:Zn-finger nucleic acid-binding protein
VPKCPTCRAQLFASRCEGVVVHVCPDGHGSLVEEEAIERIKRGRQRRWDPTVLGRLRAEAQSGDILDPIRCPKCLAADMQKVEIQAEGIAFHLDRCNACRAVWVDHGELELIQIKYQKEIDKRTPEDLAKAERLALAEFRFKRELDREDEDVQDWGRQIQLAGANGPFVGAALLAARAAQVCLEEGMKESWIPGRIALFVVAILCLAFALFMAWVVYEVGWHRAGVW